MKLPLLALALLPAMASAQTIERYPSPSSFPAPILVGVSIPAGSDTLYLSGQIASPIDPKTPLSPTITQDQLGDTKTQTVSILTKIKAALEAHGYKLGDVVKLTVFVAGDPKAGGKPDFAGMNAAFKQFFATSENPNTVTRSAVQVAGLTSPAFLVEIEAIAAKSKN